MTRPAAVPDEDRTFTALTFNVYYGTDLERLLPTLREAKRRGVTLWHFQEAGSPGFRKLLREELGLRSFLHPQQYLMAWDPSTWHGLDPRHGSADRYGVRLSDTAYYRVGGDHEQYTDAAVVELEHKPSELSLQAMSYHTPAHVQVQDKPPRRLIALREAAETWGALQREAIDVRGLDAVLYAGDDNVDEHRGLGSAVGYWDFMLKHATGLTQVTAPEGTHGRGDRRIDDFRQRGLRRVGDGFVLEHGNPSDHNAYGQTFMFRRLRPGAELPR